MRVRELPIVLCAVSLAACSFEPNLPPAVDNPQVAPTPEKATNSAHSAAASEKLIDPIEVSEIR